MTMLTQNLGQSEANARTSRMRRLVDPTDTIVLIGTLPPVPAPSTRRPGGDRDTRRDAATTMPTRRLRLTPKGEGYLWAVTILLGVSGGIILPRAAFETVLFFLPWAG